MPESSLALRRGRADDIPALIELLFDHGANEWNHLPELPIRAHLNRIADDRARAVIAEEHGALVGFVSFELGTDMAEYQPPERRPSIHGIIHEAVVRRDRCGRGIGAQLLEAAVQWIAELGCREVYVGRHDENLGSAGMMRKAGFEVIDVYDDFSRRTAGNRRTAICRRIILNGSDCT
jgi:L-amino acid N-acyltransferase YncA